MSDHPVNDDNVSTTAGPTDPHAPEAPPAAPPRRRRAASRPAGPPAEVTVAPDTSAEVHAHAGAETGDQSAPAPARASRSRGGRGRRRQADELTPEPPAETATTETADYLASLAAAIAGEPIEQTPRGQTEATEPSAVPDAASEQTEGAPVAAEEAESTPAGAGEAADEELDETEADAPAETAGGDDAGEQAAGDDSSSGDDSGEEGESDQEDDSDHDDSQDDESQDDESQDDESQDDDSDSEQSGGSSRRRRRRRGGRRRRRSGDGGGESDDSDSENASADDAATVTAESSEPSGETSADSASTSGEDDGDDNNGQSEGGRRRRRRRRRRGEDPAGADDDPSDVVVRVREPRSRRSSSTDEVTGIEGSTRMEAKRQRRKDGRAASRRRAPILSEAEFLARRESVERVMAIRQKTDYNQIAVLEDGVLVEHYVDRASATSLIGNIYLGRIQNVLPSMEAAFIDIGRGRNAVLYAGEVDWDAFGAEGQGRQVEKVFKSGQSVLVQVTKDPVGAKGARLTGHISLPGRYIVYSPGGHLSGISRKLPDTERQRLKDILGGLIGDDESVIVRTAAEGATEDELVRDVNRLKAQWEVIEKKVKQGNAPQQLYAEPDLTVRIVRDLFTEDFGQLVVDGDGNGDDAYDAVEGYVKHVAPHLEPRLVRWNRADQGDLFDTYRVDEQIAKALERKVFLPSGGSLIIDRTEAMTVIDVNTGKFTGTGGNLEATVTSNNLEAAEEIVRQLRLRDIGGIIVVDFIDMVLPSNRELLLRRLVECLGRDRTRHQVAEVTSLGLVQMTRKKIGTGLAEAFTEVCDSCDGRGYQRFDDPVDSQEPADGGERSGRRRRRG